MRTLSNRRYFLKAYDRHSEPPPLNYLPLQDMKIVKKFTQPKFCTQKKRKLRQLQIFNAKLTTKMPTISQFGLIGEK